MPPPFLIALDTKTFTQTKDSTERWGLFREPDPKSHDLLMLRGLWTELGLPKCCITLRADKQQPAHRCISATHHTFLQAVYIQAHLDTHGHLEAFLLPVARPLVPEPVRAFTVSLESETGVTDK